MYGPSLGTVLNMGWKDDIIMPEKAKNIQGIHLFIILN
jgi:hypothetical protein